MTTYKRGIGVINFTFKSNLVHKHTRINVYKTMARRIFIYGPDDCTIWET